MFVGYLTAHTAHRWTQATDRPRRKRGAHSDIRANIKPRAARHTRRHLADTKTDLGNHKSWSMTTRRNFQSAARWPGRSRTPPRANAAQPAHTCTTPFRSSATPSPTRLVADLGLTNAARRSDADERVAHGARGQVPRGGDGGTANDEKRTMNDEKLRLRAQRSRSSSSLLVQTMTKRSVSRFTRHQPHATVA